jgi:hypothetical protein
LILAKEEGIEELTGTTVANDAFQWCCAASDERNARRWAQKSGEYTKICMGGNSEEYKNNIAKAKNPRSWKTWGLA